MKTELQAYLDSPRPQTRLDWEGKPVKIDWPKGRTIARCGEVYLLQCSKHKFAVVYGLEVVSNHSANTAAESFGQCCLHQAACEGFMID